MQEKGFKRNIQIEVSRDHTFEDHPEDQIPVSASPRSSLFSLLAEFSNLRATKSLLSGE